jgi:hypothetical protein
VSVVQHHRDRGSRDQLSAATVWAAGGCKSWYLNEKRTQHQPLAGHRPRLSVPNTAFRYCSAPRLTRYPQLTVANVGGHYRQSHPVR